MLAIVLYFEVFVRTYRQHHRFWYCLEVGSMQFYAMVLFQVMSKR